MSGASDEGGFDLAQFYQVFYEEAGENLVHMEALLLGLDMGAADDETLNAIFRCAHSIKGGAATFGFEDLAQLTHVMETLLDRLRRRELAPTSSMVDTLLAACDALRAMLLARQTATGQAIDTTALQQALRNLSESPVPAPAPAPASSPVATPGARAPQPPAPGAVRDLEVLAGPLESADIADDLLMLFQEVKGLGELQRLSPSEPDDDRCARFRLRTTSTDDELLDLCEFHLPRGQVRLRPWPAPAESAADHEIFSAPPPAAAPAAPASEPASAPPPAPPPAAPRKTASETIRVAVDKVDQLINMMGELVITQAMLAQRAARLSGDAMTQLSAGLVDLERTTRDLQESVMSIRMIPMADVFGRFPRMVRDLASRLGKEIDLSTIGEATELDKGMIEKLTDPLTHLVRNAVDHGIESPLDRQAAGKPRRGTVTLSAAHEGGSIVIRVADDGRGLDRERLLSKARRTGIPLPADMTDAQIWQLIFAPGFSTAEAVTDVSGRGVGMDVVKRNIQALGGSVEIDNLPGQGMGVSVRLPLTLAIMDGMSVTACGELYVIPISCVIESFQAQPGQIRTLPGRGRVVRVREDYLPVVPLSRLFHPGEPGVGGKRMHVVVEAAGRRVALELDELVGQQQVVVKNLEANYRRVAGFSGATIMADGRVALILDVATLAAGVAESPQVAPRDAEIV